MIPIVTLLALSLFRPSEREVAVRVEPPQEISAITLASGSEIRSVEVHGGKARVPSDLPLPWRVALTRFEQLTYTQEDLDKGRSILLRELGTLRGMLRPPPHRGEQFVLTICPSGTTTPEILKFVPDEQGTFSVRLAAGLYAGAFLGPATGSRVRSGIIVKPGTTTDLSVITCEPTVAAVVRIVDAKSGLPIPSAAVRWDPPGAFNSDVARVLYGPLWSTTTDRAGIASFQSVGPLPIPVRWRVESKGYVPAWTAQPILAEKRRAVLADTRLQVEAALIVRVHLPRDRDAFRAAAVTVSEPEDERSGHFNTVARAQLREGETHFVLNSYGRKRVSILNAANKPIFYRDVTVDAEHTILDVDPQPLQIHGLITRNEKAVSGVLVTLADPNDARVILRQVPTDGSGQYTLTTFQAGKLFLYTIESTGAAGTAAGTISKTINVDEDQTDYEVNFDLPSFGLKLRVVDAATNAPVRAHIDKRVELTSGTRMMETADTDEQGRFVLTGYGDGIIKLHLSAKRYRAADLTVPLREDPPETLVRLEAGKELAGRVVDEHGVPVAGARVTGGYADETAMQPYFRAFTDGNGHFSFDSGAEPGTLFYVAAPRHALAITTLEPSGDNTITLSPPNATVVSLISDNAPLQGTHLIMAAPSGGRLIPLGAFDDVSEMNGMSPYQLLGCGKDGVVILQEFLPPGSYELFLAEQGGSPFNYRRIGTIKVPADHEVVLSYKTK